MGKSYLLVVLEELCDVVLQLLEFVAVLGVVDLKGGGGSYAVRLHHLNHIQRPTAEVGFDVLFHFGVFVRYQVVILELGDALLSLVSKNHVQGVYSGRVHPDFIRVSFDEPVGDLIHIKAAFEVGIRPCPRTGP